MKKLLILLALLSTTATADTYVNPHFRKDGTFVQGHMRSSPDSSTYNNYSSQGNTNPYTGSQGYTQSYGGGYAYDAPSDDSLFNDDDDKQYDGDVSDY